MKRKSISPIVFILLILTLSFACQTASGLPISSSTDTPEPSPTPSPLPPIPVEPGESNPDEPVYISGDIPYTSPFFLNMISEPFVMLEDQAGFIRRDREFEFSLQGQVIGPVEIRQDNTIAYNLALPSIPQGTQVDLDNNGMDDTGVQVFTIAFWSNTWGGPFLEKRDGYGWSNAYTSVITDPERDDEIISGTLIVWAPNNRQGFPTGFGADGLLFTDDDPTAQIPAGYSIVDLSQEPFRFYKEARPIIDLNEGEIAVNDLSDMTYADAFETLFQKVSREYPFTQEKQIDWDDLYRNHAPIVSQAEDETEFYQAIRDFVFEIPDTHISLSLRPELFYFERGGGFGLVAKELSDGRVIITQILPNSPAKEADIMVGAEILSWNGLPVGDAISAVISDFGPYSTEHHNRLEQLAFLTRVPPEDEAQIKFINPGEIETQDITMEAIPEYESLFQSFPIYSEDELSLPIQGEILSDSGLGYLRINTFSEDYSLLAATWEYFITQLIDNETPGLIIDLRRNSGGSGNLALDFAGYFFDEEIPLYEGQYYNENSGEFESDGVVSRIQPAPQLYDGPIAVLVSPYCVSACEGFAYALAQQERSIIVGHYPTAGAFGEVARGQYELPDDLSMQFPTGRPVSPLGEIVIEGIGVVPDILVPVTEESVLGQSDPVLRSAISELLNRIEDDK